MDMSERARKIWEEIDATHREEHPTDILKDGELTVQMYRALHPNRSENATRCYLNNCVRLGELTKRPVKIGQGRGFAYCPAELEKG